jgi:hypothetical protein
VAILILALMLILIVAAVFNEWSGLEQFVALPSWIMRVLWLPLVLLLGVLIVGLIWGLWRLAGEERRTSQFPDIDWAWYEAILSLRRAGVGLNRVPLFVVLGEPANGIESLFQRAGMSFTIADIPRRPDAPLKVYATRDAIFLACPGTSLLARLALEMTARSRPRTSDRAGPGANRSTAAPGSTTERAPVTPAPQLPSAPGDSPGVATGTATVTTPATAPTTPSTAVIDHPEVAASGSAAPQPSVLSRTEEVELLDERLRHLCGLIVRDRRPFCPANGILAILPYAATDNDSQARQVGTACHLDLTAARSALGVSCPVFALLSDMEEAKCFNRLIRAYASDPRYRLLGRSFPLVPDMDIPERVKLIETGMEWICQSLISPMVYRLLQLDPAVSGEGAKYLQSNTELVQFLSETHERWQRLGRTLGRVLSLDPQGDLMLGGSYLAATGETEGEEGFVAGVLQTLLENQNFVAWTNESLRSDRSASRRAAVCNLGSLAVIVLAITMVYLLWIRTP